jgi:hypothetical protein
LLDINDDPLSRALGLGSLLAPTPVKRVAQGEKDVALQLSKAGVNLASLLNAAMGSQSEAPPDPRMFVIVTLVRLPGSLSGDRTKALIRTLNNA